MGLKGGLKGGFKGGLKGGLKGFDSLPPPPPEGTPFAGTPLKGGLRGASRGA